MASEERRGSNALSWKPNEMGLGDDDDDDDFMKSRTSQHSNLDQFESRIVGRSHSSVCSSYIDAEWSELRRSVAQVLIKPMFDVVICFIILLQFSMVVWETNVRAAEGPDSVPMVILVCEKLFLMIFIIEVGCRAFAFRMQVLRNSWSMFEVILVVLDLISELLAFALGRIPSITALRIVKILRIGRFGKVIRLLPIFRELYMMLHGFVSSMRAIMWATILLFFMLTVWSVLAVEILHPVNQEVAADGLYDGCDRCARAFESAQASVVTFIQHIVAGDSWGLVSIPIMEKQPWTSVIFMSVFISVDLGLLNLILTVIVDRAAQARQEDKRFLLQQREHEFQGAAKNLIKLCEKLDEDGSKTLSKEELVNGFDNQPEFREAMQLMEVNREDITSLFTILDEDGNGSVEYEEFVEQLHRMKSQDLQMLLVFVKSYIKEIRSKVEEQVDLTRGILLEEGAIQEKQKHIVELLTQDTQAAEPYAPPARPSEKSMMPMIGSHAASARSLDSFSSTLGPGLDRVHLHQQLTADLAAATCSIVDATISRFFGSMTDGELQPGSPDQDGNNLSRVLWQEDVGSGSLREVVASLKRIEDLLYQAPSATHGFRLPTVLASPADGRKTDYSSSLSSSVEELAVVGATTRAEPSASGVPFSIRASGVASEDAPVIPRSLGMSCCALHRELTPRLEIPTLQRSQI